MTLKLFITVLTILFLINCASAYTIGVDGDEIWSGNSTVGSNASIRQSTGYVVAMQELNTSWDEWWFDNLSGATLLNENRTSAHDLTLNTSLWNSGGYQFDALLANAIDTGVQYSPMSALTFGIKFNTTGPDEAFRGELLTERSLWVQFRDNTADSRMFQMHNGSAVAVLNYDAVTFNTTQTLVGMWDDPTMSFYDVDEGLLGTNNMIGPTREGVQNFAIGGYNYAYEGYVYAIKLWKNESITIDNYSKIFDYRTTGDINVSFSNDTGVNMQGDTYIVNFTGNGTVMGYSSDDNISWTLDNANITSGVEVDITSQNQTQYIRIVIVSSADESPQIINVTLTSESSIPCTPTIIYNVTYYNPDNMSYNLIFDLNRTDCVVSITINYTGNASRTYSLHHPNNTIIGENQTTTYEGQNISWTEPISIFTNGSGYWISEIAYIKTISCTGWCYLAMNYTNQTLGEIDTNLSNDIVQAGYNSTLQRYRIHRSGRLLFEDYNVTQRWGYSVYFSEATDVYVTIPETIPSINLLTGWNLVGHLSTSDTTIGDILTDIGVSATEGCYNNVCTNATTVPAGEALMVYVTENTEWSGS